MKISRRLFSLTTLPSVIAGLLWPTATQARLPPPAEPPEVYTPRLSWEYVPTQVATVDDAEMVTDIFHYREVVLIRLHGMPMRGPSKKLLYRVTPIMFSRVHPDFAVPICGRWQLDAAIRTIESYKRAFELTAAETACLDRLICFISTGEGKHQPLPIPMREFIVQWSGQPDEEPPA